MKNNNLFLLSLVITTCIFFYTSKLFTQQLSDSDQSSVEFIPHGWTFDPLIANTFEARVGLLKHFDDNRLRLDIGNSIDLVQLHFLEQKDERISFGADFFTFTALRQQKNFHFPVDAVDYLFGINFSYQKKCNNEILEARLRISHISAHLVDGSYDKENSVWRDGRLPKVYSREFIDAVGSADFNWLRFYGGAQFLFHLDPSDLPKWSYQLGIEFVKQNIFEQKIHPYFAYDLKFISISKYAAVHSLQTGIKFGYWRGRGFNLFFAAYNGLQYHGEYYDMSQSYSSLGFTFDF